MSIQTSLSTILQCNIFSPSIEDQSHFTLLVTHTHQLPVRPLHLPLLFIPVQSSNPYLQHSQAFSTSAGRIGSSNLNNTLAQNHCAILSLSETKKHYESIYQRLNRSKASFRVIDMFEYLVNEKEKNLSKFLDDLNLENIKKIVIDDFHVLSFYFSTEEMIQFVRKILKLNVHLILSLEKISMMQDAHDIMCSFADTIVNTHGLESGYSNDVHGIMQISYSTIEKDKILVREKSLQYKVTDTEVKLFAKGYQGLF